MEHTQEQLAGFREDYAKRRRRQLVLGAALAVLALAAVPTSRGGGPEKAPGPEWVVAFVVFAVGALVFSLQNWRCPACRRYLGRTWNPRFCPHCGVALRAAT